jgi:hypothetical protein
MFADFLRLRRTAGHGRMEGIDIAGTRAYRLYVAALTVLPLTLLWFKVQQVQLVYGIVGAIFMPFVAPDSPPAQ